MRNHDVARMLRVYWVAGYQDVGKELLGILDKALSAGLTCFQFRDKGIGSLAHRPDEQRALAERCRDLCWGYGVPFVVNDDAVLARDLNADGLHIGQSDGSVEQARKLMPEGILGLSVNTLEQALWANKRDDVDYLGVGPIFATASKVDHETPVGLDFIRTLRDNGVVKPLVAIGGIKRQHVAQVHQLGANGVAVVSEIAKAVEVERVVKALK